MDSSQWWATVFGVGGIGAILLTGVKGLMDWLNGKHGREKARNRDVLDQRNDAWAERDRERERADKERARADREATRKRQISEYASTLRSMLIELGVDHKDLPPWPEDFRPTR